MDTYDELIKNFNDAYFMDTPKFTIFRDGHVFDENMSVKWNREELERVNKETLSKILEAKNSDEICKILKEN